MPWRSKKIIRYLPNVLLTYANLHILILAISGAGKSTTLETILCLRRGKWKCIDGYDEARAENMTYSLPQQNPNMLRLANYYNKESILHGKVLKAEKIPNEVIMPCGKKLSSMGGYIEKLPKNIKVISLDPKTLSVQDLKQLLGTTENTKNLLSAIEYDYGDKIDIFRLKKILEDPEDKSHHMQKKSILNDIKSMLNSGMFDEKFPRLDFDKMMNDTDTITSISAFPLDTDKDRATFFGIMYSNIISWRLRNQKKHRVCLGLREVSHFGGRELMEGYNFPHAKVKWIAKEGRDAGIDLVADAQFRTQIIPEIRTQFGVVVAMKCVTKEAESLGEIIDIPKDIIKQIPKLDIGTGVVIDGKGYHYPVKIPPPLHHHKERGESVFALLIKEYGEQDV